MPTLEMPRGQYLSTAIGISPHSGGQTRAMLMRNRILARETGARPVMATVGAIREIGELREELLERGMLIEELPMLNIYAHYREHGWGEVGAAGDEPLDLGRYKTSEEFQKDGAPWRLAYELPGEKHKRIYDYLRPDGTPFLRIPAFKHGERRTWPDNILQLGRSGEVVGRFGSVAEWYRRWIRELTSGAERAFVFIDTRRLVSHIAPMQPQRIHLIYLMHNIHVQRPWQWNSRTTDVYRAVLQRIGGLDAMVTLTHRQQDDIAQRCGRTNNLFVVPNPVDLPRWPAEPPSRDPNQVTIVARLAAQKRLQDALVIFQHVVKTVHKARLDIYGDGPERAKLEALAEDLGIADAVTFHGHDPYAPQAFWRSSAFLMTSAFEGWGMTTLESMSHGCPAVAYDIKYGPREQVTDGVDGFVVPPGDVEGAAARVVELLQSPKLVASMGAAARAKAEQHGTQAFIADWATALRGAQEQKSRRVEIGPVDLRVEAAGTRRNRPLALLPAMRRGGRKPRFEFVGHLSVQDGPAQRAMDDAQISLAAVEPRSGEVTDLPLTIRRRRDGYSLKSAFDHGQLPSASRQQRGVDLRVRLTWRNRSWTTTVPFETRGP